MFEYGYETTRKCTTRSTPAIDARAWPKSTCAVPGAHASRAYPSDSARCRSRHRLTQRRTDGYEPSNPRLAQPLPHPHGGMPLLAREPGISGRPPEVDWVLFPVFYWVTGVTCD